MNSSKMKLAANLAVLGGILSDGLGGVGSLPRDRRDLSKEGITNSIEEGRLAYKRLLLEKKGVQAFEIDGKFYLARNYKNALKKANKK